MSFKSAAYINGIKASIEQLPAAEKTQTLKKVNGVFQFDLKNASGDEKTWVMDLKTNGTVTEGKPTSMKPDIVIATSDDSFVDLATGKLNGQKAFMQGKIKVKGNMMLATRLDGVLKTAKPVSSPAPSAAPAAKPATPANASSLTVPGVASSQVFSQIKAGLTSMSEAERTALVQKTKAVYQFNIKSDSSANSFTLDLKNGSGDVFTGTKAGVKPDITITIADKDFAFMSGKLKIQGQMMLATKLDTVLKSMQKKPKL
ncbi:hypothetical protein RI367_002098 [Sorochytrium milnesiophthora]